MDSAGVASSIGLLHSLEHDGAIIAGSVPHQVYTVLEAAPVLRVPHRYVGFGVIVQHNLLLEGKGKMIEIARTGGGAAWGSLRRPECAGSNGVIGQC